MSTGHAARAAVVDRPIDGPSAYRVLAVGGAAALTASYLAPLYHVVDVVGRAGGLELFVLLVGGVLGLAAVLGRTLPLRHAVVLGAAFMVAGLGAYLLAIPAGSIDPGGQLRDTVALVTGLSVLRMTAAAVWALGFTPGPLFVSTYLFVRRRYVLGVLVGGAALAFFLSTGDVGVVHGLVGTLGAIAAVGFGRLDRDGGTAAQRDAVVVLLVAVLVVTTSVSLVPGGQARPLLPGNQGNTVEASLVDGGDSVAVLGSIELSPAVRFLVTADRGARWRVGAFDRYTGSGWVRSGQSQPYEGPLERPVGESAQTRQTYEVISPTNVMPAAWKPTHVDRTDGVLVTSMAAFQPADTLSTGDSYTVISARSQTSRSALRSAGTGYPAGLRERYTQLPESTPDRVGAFTADLTADAESPYEAARIVEDWLETNKAYSLEVDRPEGDVAASFIFEMERGYCTYYATAMVAMLRTQDIPARLVVGYTAGERVGPDQWVVRGLDSHAWVEVYFPGSGWVTFDPTPAAPRQAAEAASIRAASGDPGVVTPAGTPQALTPGAEGGESTTAPQRPNGGDPEGTPTIPAQLFDAGVAPDGASDDGGIPDERTLVYGLILLAGAATAAHRTGLVERARRLVWLRRLPTGPPARRVARTFDRLDYLLGRRFRPRRADETPRAYLRSLERWGGRARTPTAGPSGESGPPDRRVARLFDLYEQAHYAGRVTAAEADRAWELLCELREEWSDRA